MINKKTKELTIPVERVEQKILIIRDQEVIIDADLADLYDVSTKVLNQAIKRNQSRFPADFGFRLSFQEKRELVTNCDRFKNLKHSTTLPYAFTEHGALMAATVLNSKRAVDMSLIIIRTFIKLRQMLAQNKDLAKKINELEKEYDERFSIVFKALKKLMQEPEKPKKHPIGFNTK
jgi:hypothetical protein